MAAYEYTALDATGREQRGVLDGDSARQVRSLLREQSLLPVTVTEISDAPAPKTFEFSLTNRIGTTDLALLTRHVSFADMMGARAAATEDEAAVGLKEAA